MNSTRAHVHAECNELTIAQSAVSLALRNDTFLCLAGRYDWRGICGGKALLIEASEQRAPFFRRVAREGVKASLFLGGPVNVHLGKDRKSGEYIYIVKWKGWASTHNTKEPEAQLIACSVLLSCWKNKKKSKPHRRSR